MRALLKRAQGTYKFKKNNARYVGDYSGGKKEGFGTFYYPDGSKYEGAWHEDQRSGQGKYTYANGDQYDGEWANNVREGKGTYTYALTGSKVRSRHDSIPSHPTV